MFFYSIGCLFILLFPLLYRNFLVWCSPTCLFLLLLSNPKKSLLRLKFESLPPFPLRNFVISGLMFNSLIHLSWFCVQCKTVAQFHSFTRGVQFSQHHLWKRISLCPVFPAPLMEENILFPWYILGLFLINYNNVWVCLWALYSVPLIYMSVFMPIPYCFDS